jgi:hypothetical protein
MKRYKVLIPDYNKLYENDNEHNTDMTRLEYGLYLLKKLIYQKKRNLITKSEYNAYRSGIENQLFNLDSYKYQS